MSLTDQTFSLLKPFVSVVDASGNAAITISHNQAGLIWQVFQIGFALGQTSLLAQVGAHFNGLPLTSTVQMQPVMFTGVPYRMESYFVGPPYVGLKANDSIYCTVINAVPGDRFTAGLFMSEEIDPFSAASGNWR